MVFNDVFLNFDRSIYYCNKSKNTVQGVCYIMGKMCHIKGLFAQILGIPTATNNRSQSKLVLNHLRVNIFETADVSTSPLILHN